MNKIPRPVIVIVLIVIAAALYFGISNLNPSNDGTLTASGSIEATIVNVSPEIAGRVLDVALEEGAAAQKDHPLLHLDPSLLAAQRAVAAAQSDSANAALATAQTNYDLAVQTALTQQQAKQAKDWRFSAPEDFAQPVWYFDATTDLKSAQTEVEAAQAALETAQADLQKVTSDLSNANFLEAEQKLADARAAYYVADTVKKNADSAAEGSSLQKAANDAYDTVLEDLRDAQDTYDTLVNTNAATDILDARGTVAVAQQRYDAAYARFVSLQTGLNSPAVVLAGKALDQAKSAAAQAEANLALLDTQIAKLEVHAPIDSVVLTRNVEPGEFIQPGAVALTLADITDLTITVYVPEDRYGQVSLGQSAEVSVDSFPGITFTATVIQISNQAEFTPRNVQTVEGRSAMFYAIKLKLDNPEGKLKIGMPADVVFK